MISEELKEKILPHLREIMPREDWDKIPGFFERVYYVKYNDSQYAYVMGYWGDPNPVVAFDESTGLFLGVVMQDWALEHGVLV